MANLYDGTGMIYTQKDLESRRQATNLFELLTSERIVMVDGIKIIVKGSPDWNEYIANIRKKREELGITQEEIERIMDRESANEIRTQDTSFHAMHYRGKRLLYDHEGGIIGKMDIARKQIDFFHLLFSPVDTAKKAREFPFVYDGLMRDALEEFVSAGYTFNLLDVTWKPDFMEDGERRATLEITKITPIKRVTIDDVLRFSGQNQE